MLKQKIFSTEQIIMKLQEADVLIGQGKSVRETVRAIKISELTYYRWREEYGELDRIPTKKLKELEKENTCLKHLVAELSLDNTILKDALSKK